ncbi:Endoplasmic reticulum transmembrane protein 3 [Dimargaris xerosporica]|nr:Endoplasmic reticulum transmembrane protein 3 [Dimargaris xerosporica]KAJ1980675.1 Endoplasmic reticulum transmembrane protein 3 [Dimargaris xerosporica]
MALHYTLIFALLVFECATFVSLIAPVPIPWRRKLLYHVSKSNVIASLFYWLRVIFVFVFLLFVDAVVRMQRTEAELRSEPITDARMESQLHARKFYSQRNVYLTGFTLFLGIILSGTYHLILDLLKRQDEFESVRQRNSEMSKKQALSGSNDVEALQKELAATRQELKDAEDKVKHLDNLKKQAENQHQEYMRLADKYNALERSTKASGSGGGDKEGAKKDD